MSSTVEKEYPNEVHLTLYGHLKELRSRIFKSLIALILLFILGLAINDSIWIFIMSAVPEGLKTYTLDPFDGFILRMKIAFYFSVYIALPVLAFQVYGFIRPALRNKEDKTARIFIFGAFVLLSTALGFTHLVMPYLMESLLSFSPPNSQALPDAAKWVSRLLTIYLGFSILFQVPLVILLSIAMDFVEASFYKLHRKWVIVILLILCAIFSPPDLGSQILIFIPLYVLFELAILVGSFWRKKRCSD